MLQLAGSLKRGWVTASLFISKLQAYPRQNVLTRALQEYGRLGCHNQMDFPRAVSRIFQTPPDLVVKFQHLDIANVILRWVLRPHVVDQREIIG